LGAGTPEWKREANIARWDRLARTPPETAAAKILRGVERREGRILIGIDAYQVDFLQRLQPASYWKSLAKKMEDPRAASRATTLREPGS